MSAMTAQEIFKAIDEGMAEIAGKLASGELDGSGRYWTDEELSSGVAKEGKLHPVPVEDRAEI
jgi:hypothetical protein